MTAMHKSHMDNHHQGLRGEAFEPRVEAEWYEFWKNPKRRTGNRAKQYDGLNASMFRIEEEEGLG